MKIVFRHTRPQTVLYVRSVGPYRTGADKAWQALGCWLDARKARPLMRVSYGLFRDNPRCTASELLRYDACIPLVVGLEEDAEAGIARQVLPAGAYAVHTHTGAIEMTGQLFSRMVRNELPARGLTLDDSRPLMAVYLTDPTATREVHRRTELCIPIVPIQVPLASNQDDRHNGSVKSATIA